MIDKARLHFLNDYEVKTGTVVYWMVRDFRSVDNWSLVYAREIANNNPIIVFVSEPVAFMSARQKKYFYDGLLELKENLAAKNIQLVFRLGDPVEALKIIVNEVKASLVVSDFFPLREVLKTQQDAASNILVPFVEIDSHNIVPARFVTDKQEYAARTIRPKIAKLLPHFLLNIPEVSSNHKMTSIGSDSIDYFNCDVEQPITPVVESGETTALIMANDFIKYRLSNYDELRNDPNSGANSYLSAAYHFGFISTQKVANMINLSGDGENQQNYLEEMIIRRELTDNFCLFNEYYDSLNGAAQWAYDTLDLHRSDVRKYEYGYEEFFSAKTHSDLWNAAQNQLIKTGYMHGYMRMFWAKKILEWSKSPEDALKIAIKLNDELELDGNDPNGYVGVMWSIAGIHDRGWKKRSIYGSIRYMNENGCRRKFDVDRYIRRYKL